MSNLAWLDEIEARCNAATPGTWLGLKYDEKVKAYRLLVYAGPPCDVWKLASLEDFAFIFRARTDVPRLCRAVRELSESLNHALMLLFASDVPDRLWKKDLDVLERWKRGGGPVPCLPASLSTCWTGRSRSGSCRSGCA